jgi:pimeloyl-ACP methyl ester carboxylesterase
MTQNILMKIFKKPFARLSAAGLLLVLFFISACTRCPAAEYGDLRTKISSQETKNNGVDLKGWTYEKAVSKTSGQAHYYYRFDSPNPDAPTFVFIHGLIFDGKNFLDFKPLAKDFNLIAYDLPGKSSFYRGGADDFADLLDDFLKTLLLEKIYLGGVSLGGQIAAIYAAKPRAASLQGLALISTAVAENEKSLKKSKRLAKATLRITDREEDKTLCIVTKLVNRKKDKSGEKQNALDNFVLRDVDFYNQVLDVSLHMEHPIALKSITAPTLIIHGDKDSVIPIEEAQKMTPLIPNATFVTVPGGEHTVAYSNPDKIIRQIEKRFVAPH